MAECPFVYPSPDMIENPFPFYAWLREEAPVHRLEDGSFLVSRWDDIAHIVRHPELFSNKIGPTNDAILGGPRLGGDASGPWPTSFADLPEHRAQRVISSTLVTRERLASFEPIMLRNVDLLIDSFPAAGTVEFRSSFASLLPGRVMMDTLVEAVTRRSAKRRRGLTHTETDGLIIMIASALLGQGQR
jgi:cytochrome P450